jgi:hydroxymethylbilane synthase
MTQLRSLDKELRLRELPPGIGPCGHTSKVPPHMRPLPMRVGTRGSPLAVWQALHFVDVATQACPFLREGDIFEAFAVNTTGDQVQDRRLAEIGGKGLFAKELHEALLDGRVDIAVHCLKDLETELPPGITVACTMRREDPRDALILGPACLWKDGTPWHAATDNDPYACLPRNARIATASVRRQGQLLHARPDLSVEVIRGNVQTRLGKVRSGDGPAASLLAIAGLNRLGMQEEAGVVLDPEVMVPAAGQGTIAITVRADDLELRSLLAVIECRETFVTSAAERALLGALDGSCRTPIGGFARLLPGDRLRLTGLIARPDGSFLLKRVLEGAAADAARIGHELGDSLRRDCPADILS